MRFLTERELPRCKQGKSQAIAPVHLRLGRHETHKKQQHLCLWLIDYADARTKTDQLDNRAISAQNK